MRLQCSCGFAGILAGGGRAPTRCPVCKTGALTTPIATSPCSKCSLEFPLTSSACPACGVERITRQRSKENGSAPIPDDSPPPRK
jgi:predicted Zn-ribbon and HTH transcriptional regulator